MYGNTKIGVMIRDGLTPRAVHALLSLYGGAGQVLFLSRGATGGGTADLWGATAGTPYWLKLVRVGQTISAYGSANGSNWFAVGGPVTLPLGTVVYAGLAVSSANGSAVTTAVFDNLTVTSVGGGTPDFALSITPEQRTLTAGNAAMYNITVASTGGFSGTVDLTAADLPAGATASFTPASVLQAGFSTLALSTPPGLPASTYLFTVTGTSGALSRSAAASVVVNPVELSPPEFRSVAPFSGSGDSQTFSVTVSDPNGYTNIGGVQVLFNSSLSGTGACYLLYDPLTNVIYLKDDADLAWLGSATLNTAGALENGQCRLDTGASSAPGSGNELTLNLALSFKPGFAGTQNIYVLVDSGGLSSGWVSTGASWTVPVPAGALPGGWTSQDIGPSYAGTGATYSNDAFTVQGAGADIWGTWDEFRFAYRELNGDGTIVARVASRQAVYGNTKIGVMIRDGLTPRSMHAMLSLYGGAGQVLFLSRAVTGGGTANAWARWRARRTG